MVVGTCTISVYHHLNCEFEPRSWRRVLDKFGQWLATGQMVSQGTPLSPINKSDRHDITEILLKAALITIIPKYEPIDTCVCSYSNVEIDNIWKKTMYVSIAFRRRTKNIKFFSLFNNAFYTWPITSLWYDNMIFHTTHLTL